MHSFVTLHAAQIGALESPACERKNLAPKVAIGSAYVERKREKYDLQTGNYQGFDPYPDADALAMQGALLPQAKGLLSKPTGALSTAAWWGLGVSLLIALSALAGLLSHA